MTHALLIGTMLSRIIQNPSDSPIRFEKKEQLLTQLLDEFYMIYSAWFLIVCVWVLCSDVFDSYEYHYSHFKLCNEGMYIIRCILYGYINSRNNKLQPLFVVFISVKFNIYVMEKNISNTSTLMGIPCVFYHTTYVFKRV